MDRVAGIALRGRRARGHGSAEHEIRQLRVEAELVAGPVAVRAPRVAGVDCERYREQLDSGPAVVDVVAVLSADARGAEEPEDAAAVLRVLLVLKVRREVFRPSLVARMTDRLV